MKPESKPRVKLYVKVNHLESVAEEPACRIAEALQVDRHRMVPEVSGLYVQAVINDTECCNNLMKLPVADSIVGNI